jgi:glycolate oxidase FAD binding subunit
MILRPASIEELAQAIPTAARLRLRGRGTKRPLSASDEATDVCDVSALSGVIEYSPEECTFTALAATPLAEITELLARHGQWLPCDPPLVDAGATLGGTVATGLNGSCRYRFGGIRDFIIGARIVDGRGRITTSGGKVVKNAAGFLLHQALVGSCGRLAVLAELTFKVFPVPEAFSTVSLTCHDLTAALAVVARLQRARLDLDALDVVQTDADPSAWAVVVRLGGFREALGPRVAALVAAMGAAADLRDGADDAKVWRDAREFAWVPRQHTLVRIPTTLPIVPRVEALLAPSGGRRRHTVAGNLTLVSWPGPLDALDAGLRDLGLCGQVLLGDTASAPFIGAISANPFAERLRHVLDPDGRF